MQRSTAATQSGGNRSSSIGSYPSALFTRVGVECDELLRESIVTAGRQCRKMPTPRHFILNLQENRNATRSVDLVFRAAATVVSDPSAPEHVVEQIMQPLVDRLRLLRPTSTPRCFVSATEHETLIQGPTDVWQMRAYRAIATGNVGELETAYTHVVQHIAALQRVAESLLDAKLAARNLPRRERA